MSYVIGIDGGGSSSTAVVVTIEGRALAQSHAGPASYTLSGIGGVIPVVCELIAECRAVAGVEQEIPSCICLALSGAGRPRAQRAILAGVRERLRADDILVGSDGVAALMGAFPRGPGIVLIAGTGSLAIGVDERGVGARAGGWGYLLGDAGSGYEIGRLALRATLAALNGSGSSTTLSNSILEHLRLRTIHDIIDWVYGEQEVAVNNLASLAPLVFDAAEKGDVVANEILDTAGDALAGLVDSVSRQLHFDATVVPVSPIGGLFEQSYALLERLTTRTSCEIEIVPARFSPSIGAALVALRRAGVAREPDLLTALDRSVRELVSK
jgi:N-acetylglucosamine kinase-like BadF-type ATPase